MTETASAPAARQDSPAGMLAIAALGALLLAILWYFGASERALTKSAVGFDGLVSWARAEGMDAQRFSGGGFLVRGKVSLRVLPLHDVDLDAEREHPDTREAVLAQATDKDIDREVVREKIRLLPTLVVLPKWRSGMHKLGVGHRTLLIDTVDLNGLIGQIAGLKGQIRRDPEGFVRFAARPFGGDEVALMHAQYLRGSGCVPLIGDERAMLLGRCRVLGAGPPLDDPDPEDAPREFWVLADPDLMNNHGLGLGANADIAAAFLAGFAAEERPIVLDLTTRVVTLTQAWGQGTHERTWDDVLRMFRWPFTMIWIAFGLLGLLVLWRSIVRAGPLARIFEDNPTASKEVAIDAKARLLRLANHDTALLASHIRARLGYLAAELLGPHARTDRAPLDNLTRLIAPRDPALARELAAASELPDLQGQTATEILARLARFETCYDKVMHEFGRAPDSR